jgi:hypothetical protein
MLVKGNKKLKGVQFIAHHPSSEEFARYRLELIFNRRVDGFSKVMGKVGSIEWIE